MRRFTTLGVVVLAIGLFAQAALAASPHFLRISASRSGNNLIVSFKEAGLGNNQKIDYRASAAFSRTDSCVNGGRKVPSDPKKTATSGTVQAFGTFSSGKNGSISASLTLRPLATTLQCPPGQRATLMSLSYSNVSVSDLTNNVSSKTLAGPF
jgi:hypothetical protein